MFTRMKTSPDDVTPVSLLADELEFLRKTFRETAENYLARMEGDIEQVRQVTMDLGKLKKLPPGRTRELRDMLGLIRLLDVRPEKARRRDLKKMETVVRELREYTTQW